MSPTEATAFAPATVANVAVGFDLLGHSIEGPGDRVTARRIDPTGVRIAAITGIVTGLPTEPEHNTAGRAVQALLAAAQPDFGVELEIQKGIPLSSGLGGSAASAVAALVAANALLPEPFAPQALYPFALLGEATASGAAHGDNVGPALLGGLVLATADSIRSLPVPEGLWCTVVHPRFELTTRAAREVLQAPFELELIVQQQCNLARVLNGLHFGDIDSIRAGLQDALVEPRRAPLIPGFVNVQQAARDCDALGASISGGGPSVFGWFAREADARRAAVAMRRGFEDAGYASESFVSPVQGPAAHIEVQQ